MAHVLTDSFDESDPSGESSRPPPMITQREIAQTLGLASTTVANILSRRPGLRYSDETRERVFKAALEAGYQQNRASRVLRTGRSNLIAIVHFGAEIEVAHRTNQSLAHHLKQTGYDWLSVDLNWGDGQVERSLNELIQARVEGVIISHTCNSFTRQHVDKLTRARIPIVTINGHPREKVSLVGDNARLAFTELTRHLLGLGHKRLLHFVPNYDRRPHTIRKEGFRTAIEEVGCWHGIPEEAFFATWTSLPKEGVIGITVEQSREAFDELQKPVYRFCGELFRRGPLPDALVCPNDFYAFEAIAAGMECGVRVPHDIAVTGYDNDRIGEYSAFGLTTAEQNTAQICQRAVEILVERIAHPKKAPVYEEFDSRLVLRTSCGRLLNL